MRTAWTGAPPPGPGRRSSTGRSRPVRGEAHVGAGAVTPSSSHDVRAGGPDLEMADDDVGAARRRRSPIPARACRPPRTRARLPRVSGAPPRTGLDRRESGPVRLPLARAPASADPRGRALADLPSGVDAVGDRDRAIGLRAAPSGPPASCGQADGTSPAPARWASRPCPTTPRPRAAGRGRTRPSDHHRPEGSAPVARDSWPGVWRRPHARRGPTRRTARRPRATAPSPDGVRARGGLDTPGDAGPQHDQDEQAAGSRRCGSGARRHRRRPMVTSAAYVLSGASRRRRASRRDGQGFPSRAELEHGARLART